MTTKPRCIRTVVFLFSFRPHEGSMGTLAAGSTYTAPNRHKRKNPPFRITAERWLFLKEKAGTYLFSQVVSNQLSSARQSLTSVFGMGTGGTSASSAPAKYASSLAFTYSLLPEGCTLKTEYYCELANGVPKDCGQALDLLVHAS